MNFSKIYDETVNETLYFAEHESGLKVYAMPKSGFSKIEKYKFSPFGDSHVRPLLPIPAVCVSATTTAPCGNASAFLNASKFVESKESL